MNKLLQLLLFISLLFNVLSEFQQTQFQSQQQQSNLFGNAVSSAQQAQQAQQAQSAQPSQPFQSAQPAPSAQPAQPAPSAPSAQPGQPSQPIQAAQQAQPAKMPQQFESPRMMQFQQTSSFEKPILNSQGFTNEGLPKFETTFQGQFQSNGPDKFQRFAPELNKMTRAQCEILLSNKPEKTKSTESDLSELPAGLLGNLQKLTNLGEFGNLLKNTPIAMACYIRTPLNVVIGLLEELSVQIKAINGPKYKNNTPRPDSSTPSPDGCHCTSFGEDAPLPVQLIRTLESAIVTLRQIISLVNILLVTPGGGLCKGYLDNFGGSLGKGIGSALNSTFNMIG